MKLSAKQAAPIRQVTGAGVLGSRCCEVQCREVGLTTWSIIGGVIMLWFVMSWLVMAFVVAVVFGHAARRDEGGVEREIANKTTSADGGARTLR